jgi:hypothetical protein
MPDQEQQLGVVIQKAMNVVPRFQGPKIFVLSRALERLVGILLHEQALHPSCPS